MTSHREPLYVIETQEPARTSRRSFLVTLLGAVGLCLAVFFIVDAVYSTGGISFTKADDEVEGVESSGYVQRPMIRQTLDDPELVCNDGTEAVYYIRRSENPDEKRWVIRFEGGGNCAFAQACDDRWETRPQDMTTRDEEELVQDEEGGILCDDPDLNPYYNDWNAVYAHYCSSDSWLGQTWLDDEWNDSDWIFVGAHIQWGIWNALLDYHDLGDAETIVVGTMSVASNAGFNLIDYWVDFLAEEAPAAEVFLAADSGWILYDYEYGDVQQGSSGQYLMHNPLLNQNCTDYGYTWQCYYPPDFEFQFIQNDDKVMVIQQYFDKMELPFQMGDPYEIWSDEDFEWAIGRAEYVIQTAQNLTTNVFMSNCRSHDTIDKLDFYVIEVDGHTIQESLYDFVINGETPWYFDDELMPDANPSCPFDQLEWNTLHCGYWWISDCEDADTYYSSEESPVPDATNDPTADEATDADDADEN